MLVMGRDRLLFAELFEENSKESLGHAKMWGDRIVYLGGVPRGEVGPIFQSSNVIEMLEKDLEIERRAVDIYTRAHRVCKHEPTRYMLENHILDEDKDVEELQKLLGKVQVAQGLGGEKNVSSAGR
jgi:bacterioferritin (cytochrome b1)